MSSLPVLFLPGTLCDERVWLPVWKQLTLSQRRYVPLQWANSLEEMLSLTGDRVLTDEKIHIIGYSMGGYIAALWALENASQVASLTLIGYDAAGLTKEEVSRRQQMVKMVKAGKFEAGNTAYLARFIHPSRLNDETVAGVVKAMGEDLGKGTLVAHTQATTPRKPLTALLAKASFPIHIIGATEDEIARPEGVKQMIKAISPVSAELVEDSGHMLLLEKPSELADALQKIVNSGAK
ncbi:alpha/beta fold hydrolase [Alteromonas sp. H39]|uniref:alpha/beta fold hydrolase n=1 Tax=Alteromonas sp. H39 TaxID=3389876 RepID=UPI0039E1253D